MIIANPSTYHTTRIRNIKLHKLLCLITTNKNLTASIPGFKYSLPISVNSRTDDMTYDIPDVT